MESAALHIHYCVFEECIQEASGGEITRWVQYPHEVWIDQFGIYVSSKIFGRERLNFELKQVMESGWHGDSERFRLMLDWDGRDSFRGLSEELKILACKYEEEFRKVLARQQRESSTEDPRIAELIHDPDVLFLGK